MPHMVVWATENSVTLLTFDKRRSSPQPPLSHRASGFLSRLLCASRIAMTLRHYLRPTAFVDAPFGHDGKVARLAGGMLWFAAVERVSLDGGRRVESELVPVERIEAALGRLGEGAERAWQNLTSARPPLQLRERVVRLDQPQVAGILNVTPDSFSDGGR